MKTLPRRALVFLVLFISGVGLLPVCSETPPRNPLRQHWGKFSLVLRLDSTKGVKDSAGVFFSVPNSMPPFQTVSWKIREPAVKYNTEECYDDTVVRLSPDFEGPFTLEIEADVRPYDVRKQLNALSQKAALPACPPETAIYLQPTPDIDCGSPEFTRIVKPLKTANPVKTVRNILQWLALNIAYQVEWPELPISRQLQKRRGECMSWSYFFVGLCQAAGIPARTTWGFVGHNGDLPDQGTLVGHGWSEVYISSLGWVPLEPQVPVSFGNTGEFNIAPYISVAHSDPKFTYYSPTRGYQLHPSSSLILMGGNEAKYTLLKRAPHITPVR